MDLEVQPLDRNFEPTLPIDTPDELRRRRKMSNFKAAIMEHIAASNVSSSISDDLESYVQQTLQEFFPDLDTPDHPPYAWMIRSAISGLNEEGGSTEKAISSFISKENKDLPWAHATLLQHHLRKLRLDGEISCSGDGKYMLLSHEGDLGQTTCKMQEMCLREDGNLCSNLILSADWISEPSKQIPSEATPNTSSKERKQLRKPLAKTKRNVKSLESKKQDHGLAIVTVSSSLHSSPDIDHDGSLLALEVIDELKQPEERGDVAKAIVQRKEQRAGSSFDGECGQKRTGLYRKPSLLTLAEKAELSPKKKGLHKTKRYYEGEEVVCGLMARQSLNSRTNGRQRTTKSCGEPMPLSIELAQEMVHQTNNTCGDIISVSGATSMERDAKNQQKRQV